MKPSNKGPPYANVNLFPLTEPESSHRSLYVPCKCATYPFPLAMQPSESNAMGIGRPDQQIELNCQIKRGPRFRPLRTQNLATCYSSSVIVGSNVSLTATVLYDSGNNCWWKNYLWRLQLIPNYGIGNLVSLLSAMKIPLMLFLCEQFSQRINVDWFGYPRRRSTLIQKSCFDKQSPPKSRSRFPSTALGANLGSPS